MQLNGAAILAIETETERITTDVLDLVPLDKTATSTTLARRRRRAGSAGTR
ncbi:hypothetical protein [Goodfellowiella coeruleoviolacea]|uniref:hypothetical protein n=1 Tax=Goodfellowiella coeruleoviolacea TaxID=334858 RepID=UPI0020A2A770|nr:hypothetical protein [Goodfellowiella coeruleoviolacea]